MGSLFVRGAWVAAAAVLLQLAGCASFEFTKAAPHQERPIALKLSGEELSGMSDLPIGVYRVPDSHVIISGHQRGAGASMLFGLVGVAVAHAANASSGADAVKDAETQLHMKLDEPIRAVFREIAGAPPGNQYFTLDEQAGGNRLLVTPGLVLSFTGEAAVRPYVVLKVSLAGKDNKPVWTTRYIASTGAPRPLLGDGGWLSNDAAALRQSVDKDLRLALRTMAKDVPQPYARDEKNMSMVQGPFPHMKKRVQTVGFVLVEDEQSVTYVPRLGDVLTFAGVNIRDRASIKFRPAAKDDAPLKLLDDESPR